MLIRNKYMFKKSQEVKPSALVIAIVILLLVLLILIFIFGRQSSGFLEIMENYRGQITKNQCNSVAFGRRCLDDCNTDCPDGFNCYIASPPADGDSWICEEGVCCEVRLE
jgi:hypothetical protein